MLSKLLEILRNDGAADRDSLARRLGVERSALDGMLLLLERSGRLQVNCYEGAACHSCGVRECPVIRSVSHPQSPA
ncbi:MAG: FeoC-like transcriptional regulator [Chloroflexota bacterium]|jgi:Mn-dependent DtxR family transcriptional regulator